MENLLPFKEILSNPAGAWALLAIILVIYVMRDGRSREERLTNIIDGTLTKLAETLGNVNVSMISMKDIICDVKDRVEDIEEKIGICKEEEKP